MASQGDYRSGQSRLDRAGRPIPGLLNARLTQAYERAVMRGIPPEDVRLSGASNPLVPAERITDSYLSEFLIRLDESLYGPVIHRDPDMPTAGARGHIREWSKIFTLLDYSARLLVNHYKLSADDASYILEGFTSQFDITLIIDEGNNRTLPNSEAYASEERFEYARLVFSPSKDSYVLDL
jgi:hypothetical protein